MIANNHAPRSAWGHTTNAHASAYAIGTAQTYTSHALRAISTLVDCRIQNPEEGVSRLPGRDELSPVGRAQKVNLCA